MKKTKQMNRPLYAAIIAAVVLLVSGAVLLENKLIYDATVPTTHGSKGRAVADHQTTGTQRLSTNTSSGASSPSKGTQVSKSAQPTTQTPSNCGDVLTADEASSVIGSAAPSSGDGITSQTTDMTTVRCAYTAGSSDTASIVAYISRTTNGNNANEIEFGSGRPSNATAVSGYGNSAFWLADNTQLNILQSNNWYVVSMTKGGANTLQLGEQLATAAKLTASY